MIYKLTLPVNVKDDQGGQDTLRITIDVEAKSRQEAVERFQKQLSALINRPLNLPF